MENSDHIAASKCAICKKTIQVWAKHLFHVTICGDCMKIKKALDKVEVTKQ